jgi:hypothetical protein
MERVFEGGGGGCADLDDVGLLELGLVDLEEVGDVGLAPIYAGWLGRF